VQSVFEAQKIPILSKIGKKGRVLATSVDVALSHTILLSYYKVSWDSKEHCIKKNLRVNYFLNEHLSADIGIPPFV
jgi:hypothetical protein